MVRPWFSGAMEVCEPLWLCVRGVSLSGLTERVSDRWRLCNPMRGLWRVQSASKGCGASAPCTGVGLNRHRNRMSVTALATAVGLGPRAPTNRSVRKSRQHGYVWCVCAFRSLHSVPCCCGCASSNVLNKHS